MQKQNIKLDNSPNALPLYLQIKNYILNQITEKKYNVGDILPSELDFQKQFNVSRITVRNAISELVMEVIWKGQEERVLSSYIEKPQKI